MTEENLSFLEADFEILDKLGKGGMGQVFKARQKSLDRLVAIKVLPLTLCKNEEFIGRFKREARLAGKFYHPNAIQVFDIGEHKGQYYYIMEFVDGGSLKEKLSIEGKFSQEYTLEVLRQVLSVLKEAETMKIIHRDIKPDNIMLTAEGVVKLADLGLAREVNDDAGLTQQKIAIGTPHYMAPEQAQGKQVDVRADQYALGITAFHLLTGRPPFTGKNNMDILVQHVKKPMIKPSSICPEISPMMDKLILKMTEKDPKARFQTINDILKAIGKVSDAISTTKEAKAPNGTKLKSERTSLLEKRRESSSYTGLMILLVFMVLIALGYFFIDFSAYTDPYRSIKENALFLGNKLADEKRFDESLDVFNKALAKLPPHEQDELKARVNDIEKKLAKEAVEKIMVTALDSKENCEKGIGSLDKLIVKYGANAELAKEKKLKLLERIEQIKAEEQKILELEKENSKEEKINKLSQEATVLISEKKFKQAVDLVKKFKEKNSDSNAKISLLSENIVGMESDYLKEVMVKSDEMVKKFEFDQCTAFLNTIKPNLSQKESVDKLDEQIKLNPKLKADHEKDLIKQSKQLYQSTRDSIFSLLKIAELKAAKVKLDTMKEKGLSEEAYDLFSKIIENYSYIYGRIEEGLANEFKKQLKVNKVGNRNIEVFISSVKNGVIFYDFMGQTIELSHLGEDWAQTYSVIANTVTRVNKAPRLLQLCHFAYVNGDLEGAYHFAKEAESLGLDKQELARYTKNCNDDYLTWLDLQFDNVIEKANALVAENNKPRAKQILNELVKKYGDSVIYKERKQEVEKVLALTAGK